MGTDRTVVYQDDVDYAEPFSEFIWSEGNYSCDCAREGFYRSALNLSPLLEYECGAGKFVIIKITERGTDRILYEEEYAKSQFANPDELSAWLQEIQRILAEREMYIELPDLNHFLRLFARGHTAFYVASCIRQDILNLEMDQMVSDTRARLPLLLGPAD